MEESNPILDFKSNKTTTSKPQSKLGDFILGDILGRGTFGQVVMAIHVPTGEKVAIKLLSKQKIEEYKDQERVNREIKILKRLKHKNIVQLYTVLETSKNLGLVMEYCSGKELFFHIQKSQRLQESEAVNYFIQLINAIEYIHKQGITHRDLKPENILLSNSILKVIDFGLSNTYRQGEMLSTACGSPSYAPPEMILGRRYHGIYTDLWSCGIILFAMVCGHLPFHDSNEKALFTKITNGIFEVPSYITSTCKDLICRILRLNPSERITLDEIKNHGWIRAVSNKLMTSVQGLVEDIVPPIDEEIIEQMVKLSNPSKHSSSNAIKKQSKLTMTRPQQENPKDFDIREVVRELIRNKHNLNTTTYYLLLRKKLRNNGESVSDFTSELFAEYLRSQKSSFSNYKSIDDAIADKISYVLRNKRLKKDCVEETVDDIEASKSFSSVQSEFPMETENKRSVIDDSFKTLTAKNNLNSILLMDNPKAMKPKINQFNEANHRQRDHSDNHVRVKSISMERDIKTISYEIPKEKKPNKIQIKNLSQFIYISPFRKNSIDNEKATLDMIEHNGRLSKERKIVHRKNLSLNYINEDNTSNEINQRIKIQDLINPPIDSGDLQHELQKPNKRFHIKAKSYNMNTNTPKDQSSPRPKKEKKINTIVETTENTQSGCYAYQHRRNNSLSIQAEKSVNMKNTYIKKLKHLRINSFNQNSNNSIEHDAKNRKITIRNDNTKKEGVNIMINQVNNYNIIYRDRIGKTDNSYLERLNSIKHQKSEKVNSIVTKGSKKNANESRILNNSQHEIYSKKINRVAANPQESYLNRRSLKGANAGFEILDLSCSINGNKSVIFENLRNFLQSRNIRHNITDDWTIRITLSPTSLFEASVEAISGQISCIKILEKTSTSNEFNFISMQIRDFLMNC